MTKAGYFFVLFGRLWGTGTLYYQMRTAEHPKVPLAVVMVAVVVVGGMVPVGGVSVLLNDTAALLAGSILTGEAET